MQPREAFPGYPQQSAFAVQPNVPVLKQHLLPEQDTFPPTQHWLEEVQPVFCVARQHLLEVQVTFVLPQQQSVTFPHVLEPSARQQKLVAPLHATAPKLLAHVEEEQ